MRPEILTKRLILRDIVADDAQLLLDLDSDAEVMRFIGSRPSDDLGWYRERIREVYRPWQTQPWKGLWMVLDRESRDFLGWVFLRPAIDHREAAAIGWTDASEMEVGYRYHPKAWGSGIATEAAQALIDLALPDPETSAIVGCALATNSGSIRVLEKLGLLRVASVNLPGFSEAIIKLRRAHQR